MSKAIIFKTGDAAAPVSKKRRNSSKRKLRFHHRLIIFTLILTLTLACLFAYIENRIRPILAAVAEANAKNLAMLIINECIFQEMDKHSITYDTFISLGTDNQGKITTLQTDIVSVNRFRSSLSLAILSRLSDMEYMSLYIPLGTVSGGELFSGRGPRIPIKVVPAGAVTTDITNVFTAAGINQTRHQIMLEVRATISVIMPFNIKNVDVVTSICIAETVIVGDVPHLFVDR